MRIAQIAPPWEAVPPAGYGGTERVIHALTERLVALGNEVTLFASGDSVTSAKLIPTAEVALRPAGVAPKEGQSFITSALQQLYDRHEEFDVIHSHLEFLAFPFARHYPTPTLHTMHGRLDLPGYSHVFGRFRDQALVSISNSQRTPLPDQRWLATVYHGLPLDRFTWHERHEGYLLFVGRISPEKRPEWAIDIAEQSGIPLLIAAKIDESDEDFFRKEIEPRIRNSKVARYIGEVGDDEKNDLIGKAAALVMPVDWPEPFGLTAIEALACGTPVLTRPCGALPEIIEDGTTGFIDADIGRLAKAAERIGEIDRARCRKTFEERFSDHAMARDYVVAYRKLIDEAAAGKMNIVRERAPEGADSWSTLESALAASVPKHVYKDDFAFVVVDPFCNITNQLGGEFGFFSRGTRYLSRLALEIDGDSPVLLGSATRPEYQSIIADLGNAESDGDDGGTPLRQNSIHCRRELTIENDRFLHSLRFHNFEDREIELRVSLQLDADFADMFEVRGFPRPRRGSPLGFRLNGSDAHFAYMGLDAVERRTEIRFDPPPDEVDALQLHWKVRLAGRGSAHCRMSVAGREMTPTVAAFEAQTPRDGVNKNRRFVEESPQIETDDNRFNAVFRQAIVDLGQLMSSGVDGLFPSAGVPWYSTIFGRDSIITALQLLPWRTDVAVSTLRTLAHFQSDSFDDFTEREPGKILHEWREGEMANLREIPFIPYYGTADATPLFVHLAHEVVRTTGDVDLLESIWPNLLRAAEWMEMHGDLTGDGLIDYRCRSEVGLRNQGWKDSWDSVFHSDGRIAEPPIALIEVQAYAFAAWRNLGALARLRGDDAMAQRCEAMAEGLRERVEKAFWLETEGTYAIALDGNRAVCRSVTSNAGHALYCGLPAPRRAASVVSRLLQPDMISGFGIRTLSTRGARYNPVSYHDGSIWPHDNAIIAAGLRRYGYLDEMLALHRQLFYATFTFPLRRVPELYCGFDRESFPEPVPYPTACAPQAWASGAVLTLLAQMLGLRYDGATRTLGFDRPRLMEPLGHLSVRNLRVGDGEVDFTAIRREGSVAIAIDRQEGELFVRVNV